MSDDYGPVNLDDEEPDRIKQTKHDPVKSANDDEDESLKPCPFCGEAAQFGKDDGGWEWIECSRCRAAQAAKCRACVEALKDAREVLDVGGARYILGVDEAMVLIKKIDAALAGLEG